MLIRARNTGESKEDLAREKVKRIIERLEQSSRLRCRYGVEDKGIGRLMKRELDYALNTEQLSPFSKYSGECKEVKLLEKHSFADLLEHELKTRGYEVVEPEATEIDDDKVKTWKQSEAIKIEKSHAIFEAKDLDKQEYENANRREIKTPKQMAELRRYRIKNQFPGIEDSTEWGVEFIKAVTFDSPGLKEKAWTRYLFENPDLNSLLRDKNTAYTLNHGLTIDDTDLTYALVSELKSLPFHLIEGNKNLSKGSPEVKEFISEAEKCRHLPKRGKLDDVKYIGKVLGLIGLVLSKPKQVRLKDGSRLRQYGVEDKLCYSETDHEGKIIREVMLYPLLEPCLDSKSGELFRKYNCEFFEEVKSDFLGEKSESKFRQERSPSLSLARQEVEIQSDKPEREKTLTLLWTRPDDGKKLKVTLVGIGDDDNERIVKGFRSHQFFVAKRIDCVAIKDGQTEAPLQIGDMIKLDGNEERLKLGKIIGSTIQAINELTGKAFRYPINLIKKLGTATQNCSGKLSTSERF
ncbi:hypothetical protein [Dapis sp. BLCC M172]|uniref:hypothetical protein n=1 Tax=Dapis sp. BLCC M172 TaxID=2975281 RepID=UPI003CF14765